MAALISELEDESAEQVTFSSLGFTTSGEGSGWTVCVVTRTAYSLERVLLMTNIIYLGYYLGEQASRQVGSEIVWPSLPLP